MNLGNRRITNDELISIFTKAGHQGVSAYQASGNVVLGVDNTGDAARISQLLAATLGYQVPVFVRTADQLKVIASTSPIKGQGGADGGKPQIVFLGEAAHDVDPTTVFPDDHTAHLIGTEIHWLPPTGLSELSHLQKTMDQTFGPTTVRTLGTIERLVKRLT